MDRKHSGPSFRTKSHVHHHRYKTLARLAHKIPAVLIASLRHDVGGMKVRPPESKGSEGGESLGIRNPIDS